MESSFLLYNHMKEIVDDLSLQNPTNLLKLIATGANPHIKYNDMSLIHVLIFQFTFAKDMKWYFDKNDCQEAVTTLVRDYHCDINQLCDKGSALQMLLDSGCVATHYDFVKMMLTLGADPYTTNKDGVNISDMLTTLARWDDLNEFETKYAKNVTNVASFRRK